MVMAVYTLPLLQCVTQAILETINNSKMPESAKWDGKSCNRLICKYGFS